MIKMIATDLDGTLLRRDKTISQYTKNALHRCQKSGIKLVVATARPYHNALELTEGIALDGMIATNGAFVYVGNELICEHTMPVEISRALLLALGKNPNVLSISARKRNCCYRTWQQYESDIVYDFTQPLHDIVAHMAFRTEDSSFAESLIGQYPQLEIYRVTGEHLYDVGPERCTKAAGLAALAKHFGIVPAEIMAFGDDYNDIDMLRFAGTGVAMSNAINETKAVVDFVCDTNENDGVARWLAEHIQL